LGPKSQAERDREKKEEQAVREAEDRMREEEQRRDEEFREKALKNKEEAEKRESSNPIDMNQSGLDDNGASSSFDSLVPSTPDVESEMLRKAIELSLQSAGGSVGSAASADRDSANTSLEYGFPLDSPQVQRDGGGRFEPRPEIEYDTSDED